MPTIVVLFNLKPGASVQDYENWARSKDIPVVSGLPSVQSFRVMAFKNLLGQQAAGPYQYCEIIEVKDMDLFMADIQTEAVQAGAATFAGFADNPMFIVADDI